MIARISLEGRDWIITDAEQALSGLSSEIITALISETKISKALAVASLRGGILQARSPVSANPRINEFGEGLRILRQYSKEGSNE